MQGEVWCERDKPLIVRDLHGLHELVKIRVPPPRQGVVPAGSDTHAGSGVGSVDVLEELIVFRLHFGLGFVHDWTHGDGPEGKVGLTEAAQSTRGTDLCKDVAVALLGQLLMTRKAMWKCRQFFDVDEKRGTRDRFLGIAPGKDAGLMGCAAPVGKSA